MKTKQPDREVFRSTVVAPMKSKADRVWEEHFTLNRKMIREAMEVRDLLPENRRTILELKMIHSIL